MKTIKTLLGTVLFLAVYGAGAIAAESLPITDALANKPTTQSGFKQGTDYTLLPTTMPTRDSKKVEVIEFFWYGCPHCYDLEPRLEAWAAKQPDYVDFWRSPAVWGPVKAAHAQVYYTQESLGVLDKTHKAFFDALQQAQKATQKDAYYEIDDLKALFKSFGVDETKFEQTFNSFTVKSKLQQADARGRGYGIQGVPTLVVNGKYAVQGTMPRSLDVVDYLIKKERGNE